MAVAAPPTNDVLPAPASIAITITTYAVESFCVITLLFACGSMVLSDPLCAVFSAGGRKKTPTNKKRVK
jgi:hypothetical protein